MENSAIAFDQAIKLLASGHCTEGKDGILCEKALKDEDPFTVCEECWRSFLKEVTGK